MYFHIGKGKGEGEVQGCKPGGQAGVVRSLEVARVYMLLYVVGWKMNTELKTILLRVKKKREQC